MEELFKFFMEWVWAPFLGALGWVAKVLWGNQQEAFKRLATVETGLAILKDKAISTEGVRDIVQDELSPNVKTTERLDQSVRELTKAVTALQIALAAQGFKDRGG